MATEQHLKIESGCGAAGLLAALRNQPALAEAVVLCYAPEGCRFARWRDGQLDFWPQAKLASDRIYEARAFNAAGELRWRDDGRTAWLTEQSAETCHCRLQEITYLLWGPVTGVTDGDWTELATARTGPLWVPLTGLGSRSYAALRAVEYTTEDAHGNVRVSAERLVGLEGYDGKEERG